MPIQLPIAIAITVEEPISKQRGEEMPADHRQHRRPVAEGVAPVALQKIAGPVEILDQERPVQPQLLLEASDILLGHAGIEPVLRQRAAGHEVENGETDDRDDHQQHQALREAIEQEATHAALHLCQDDDVSGLPPPVAGKGPGGGRRYALAQYQAAAFQDSVRMLTLDTTPSIPSLCPSTAVFANSGRKGRS